MKAPWYISLIIAVLIIAFVVAGILGGFSDFIKTSIAALIGLLTGQAALPSVYSGQARSQPAEGAEAPESTLQR